MNSLEKPHFVFGTVTFRRTSSQITRERYPEFQGRGLLEREITKQLWKSLPSSVSRTSSRTYVGRTALGWAAGKGHLEVLRELIKYGADVNHQATNIPPLSRAAMQNHPAVIKELLEAGALPAIQEELPDGRM